VQSEITTLHHLIARFGHYSFGFVDDQRSERGLAIATRGEGDG
jgi:hypothetical protein